MMFRVTVCSIFEKDFDPQDGYCGHVMLQNNVKYLR